MGRKPIGKYDAIADFLEKKSQKEIRLRFSEIEQEIGFRLPMSARKYPEWWANNDVEGRQCMSWMKEGWITKDVDIGSERVTFVKQRSGDVLPFSSVFGTRKIRSFKRVSDATTAGSALAPDGALSAALKMFWMTRGNVNLDDAKDLVFPNVENLSGLYRMRIIPIVGKETHYIGETVDLRRRFSHFRNPGPTQQTNIRVNKFLLSQLEEGSAVFVDTVVGGVTLSFEGEQRKIALEDKATRRLLEHAAIVFESASDIESLNR